jgi:hypothetical protein
METICKRMDILNINKYNYTDPVSVDEEEREEVIETNKKRYDLIMRHKKYIFDDKCLNVHFNIINMCKTEEEIKSATEKQTDYKVKTKSSTNIKILLLNELDKVAGLSRFEMTVPKILDKKAKKNIISIKDIVSIFGIKLDELKNDYTFAEIYKIRAQAYKKLIGETDNGKGKKKDEKEDKDIIMQAGARVVISKEGGKSDRLQTYTINKDKIKEHLELYQKRDKELKKINLEIIKNFELVPEIEEQKEYTFIEE